MSHFVVWRTRETTPFKGGQHAPIPGTTRWVNFLGLSPWPVSCVLPGFAAQGPTQSDFTQGTERRGSAGWPDDTPSYRIVKENPGKPESLQDRVLLLGAAAAAITGDPKVKKCRLARIALD